MSRRAPLLVATALVLSPVVFGAAATPPPALTFATSPTSTTAADGGLRPAIGVHNIQVVRANRTQPPHADALPHTYLHAPMLAWWHGRFYLDYLSAPVNEHDAPTDTSYTTSTDGLNWETPRLLFPAITLADGARGVMHQRASFYVAPGDRLLATGFHGKAPSPNDGSGIGRVVREIRADGTLGPIYFIRVNTHAGWKEADLPYRSYRTSPDAGFVAACDALLQDRRATTQWWEEDRSTDGYYDLTLKAISTMRRPDGALVAVAKDAQHALSTDQGKTWQRLGYVPGLPVNSSKYWLQQTSDKRYAMALNPTNRLRHPLALATSDDAMAFGNMVVVHGELPPQRFPGKFKNLGPQYVRGISEGNGVPPDGALWLAYSVNKEDIWVARVPVPVQSVATGDRVADNFEGQAVGTPPASWNIYSPAWAPARVVDSGAPAGRALELRDEDPCDYSRAIRVFPATRGLKFTCKVMPRQTNGRLEIDLLTANGGRPFRLAFTEAGRIEANHEGLWTDAGPYEAGKWIILSVSLPNSPTADRADVLVDGKSTLPRALVLAEPFSTVERVSFRTGTYRDRTDGGHEIPGGDVKAPLTAFLIDDVDVTPVR